MKDRYEELLRRQARSERVNRFGEALLVFMIITMCLGIITLGALAILTVLGAL